MPTTAASIKMAILGPPGSGKGSQCVRIKERYPELCYINPTMMLRDEINRHTAVGSAAQRKMLDGEIIPPETYTDLFIAKAQSPACKAGYILDGMPTDVRQAQDMLAKGEQLDAVILLDISDEAVMRRTSGRWVHQRSGRIYHDHFARPKQPGYDDETGEKLIQRHDDSPMVAEQRLNAFRQNSESLVEYVRTSAADAKKAAKAAAAAAAASAKNAAAAAPSPPADGEAAKQAQQAPEEAAPAEQDATDAPFKPTRFYKEAAWVKSVDANGGLDTVRQRVFAAMDEALAAKRDRDARKRWWRLFW